MVSNLLETSFVSNLFFMPAAWGLDFSVTRPFRIGPVGHIDSRQHPSNEAPNFTLGSASIY